MSIADLLWIPSALSGFAGLVCASVSNDEMQAGRRAHFIGWFVAAVVFVAIAVACGRAA